MKWEVYERMNSKQRLYWQFNFNKRKSSMVIVYMLVIITTLLGLIILLLNNASSESIKNMLYLSKLSFILFIIDLIITGIFTVYDLYKEREWLKKEGLIK